MGMVMNDPTPSDPSSSSSGAKFDQRLDVDRRTSFNRSTTTSWTMMILSTSDYGLDVSGKSDVASGSTEY